MLLENPRNFCVLSTSDGKVSVAVVTESGNLCTFNHKLNGPLRKPLSPNCVLTIRDTNESSAQVPVLSCFLSNEDEAEVKVGYGQIVQLLKFHLMQNIFNLVVRPDQNYWIVQQGKKERKMNLRMMMENSLWKID